MAIDPARLLLPAVLLLAPAMASAQTAPTPPADPCARERALLAAEATTPGILQRLAAEALQRCLAQAATPGR